MNLEKKTSSFSFGFSKTKQKTSVIQTAAFKEETKKTDENIELITSIEGFKLKSLNKSSDTSKKAIVIPCQKNQTLIDTVKYKKSKDSTDLLDESLINSNAKSDDLEAIRALISDSRVKKEDAENTDLKIPIKEGKSEEKSSEIEKVEDPNYEAIDLEQFGKAALRGMGWSEKGGIGLTNKRSCAVVEPELRPKGLGLGAAFGKKKQKTGEADQGENDSKKDDSLRYVKGAYVEILNGKYKDEIAQIVSFDDGLNRILVKLVDIDQTVSLLQNFTRLVSKSEYEGSMKKKKR